MILGVPHHKVAICPHDDEWQIQAYLMIKRLDRILTGINTDICHVGTTAVPAIAANAVIDIALGVASDRNIGLVCSALIDDGFEEDVSYVTFARVFYLQQDGLRTYQIFVVKLDGIGWKRLVWFRNYLNASPEKAQHYAEMNYDNCILPFDEYIASKNAFIESVIAKLYR